MDAIRAFDQRRAVLSFFSTRVVSSNRRGALQPQLDGASLAAIGVVASGSGLFRRWRRGNIMSEIER
jgi:hypothetical protein